jgi:O-antigen/teichoic acid export membrane protein
MWRSRVIRFVKHPILTGSLVMVLGSNLANFLQYLFHPLMGRFLGVSGYGDMSALFSLTILIGTVPSTLSLVLVKFISSAKSEAEISSFLNWIYPKSFFMGIVVFLICLFFSNPIGNFLNISRPYLVGLISLLFVFNFPLLVLRSSLQGLTKFGLYSLSLVLDGFTKLLFGYLLVALGFSLTGAISGVVLSSVCSWGISHMFLTHYFKAPKNGHINLKPMLIYSLPVIFNTIATTSLFSTDVVLVKHFFPPDLAGIYASLNTVGKMILFGTGPISAAMFPLVSARHSRGFKYLKIFVGGFSLTTLFGFAALICFFLFPKLIVNLMFGSRFLSAVPYLFIFGFSMVMYTLSFYLVNFNLSVNKTRAVIFPLLASIFQVVALSIFHTSLWQVVNISLTVSSLLLCALAIFTLIGVKLVKTKIQYAAS